MSQSVLLVQGEFKLNGLIDLFWERYAQLKVAIDRNEADKITVLDRDLDPLLENITRRQTGNAEEIRAQFRFAIDLLNEEADDYGCVQRNTELLRVLVDRYVGMQLLNTDESTLAPELSVLAKHTILDEQKLDALPTRVIVVSTGYRISYTNQITSIGHSTMSTDVIGCHIAEFVGLHRFQQDLKEKLDRCFKGEASKYTYADDTSGRTTVFSFDMTPCYSPSYKLVGAMIMVDEVADRRRRAVVA